MVGGGARLWKGTRKNHSRERDNGTPRMCAPGVRAGHHGGTQLSGLDGCQWIPCARAVRCARAAIAPTHVARRATEPRHARSAKRRASKEARTECEWAVNNRPPIQIGGVIVHENRFAGVNPGARAVCGFSRGFSAVCSPAAAWRRPRAPPRGGTGGARAAAAPPIWGRCAPAHAAFAIPHGLVALRKLNRTV